MSHCNGEASVSRHPSWLIALVALTIALLSMAWMFAQDARAEEVAEPFCGGTTLAPLNKSGDKCFSPRTVAHCDLGRRIIANLCKWLD